RILWPVGSSATTLVVKDQAPAGLRGRLERRQVFVRGPRPAVEHEQGKAARRFATRHDPVPDPVAAKRKDSVDAAHISRDLSAILAGGRRSRIRRGPPGRDSKGGGRPPPFAGFL